MKFISLLLISIITSCSTYVPVKYRRGSENFVPKDSAIKVNFAKTVVLAETEKNHILDRFNSLMSSDGWVSYKKPQDNADYELFIESYSTKAYLGSAFETEKTAENPEIKRNATYAGEGQVNFSLLHIKSKKSQSYTATSSSTANSEITLPEETNTKALLPVLGLMLGYDRVEEAKKKQERELELKALHELDKKLPYVVLQQITPVLMTVNVEIDDKEDDMEAVVEFVKKNDIESAYNYLVTLSTQDPRADVLYNLGVLQEARGLHKEGCELYQRAYFTKKKDLYLKQHSACQTRYQQQPR